MGGMAVVAQEKDETGKLMEEAKEKLAAVSKQQIEGRGTSESASRELEKATALDQKAESEIQQAAAIRAEKDPSVTAAQERKRLAAQQQRADQALGRATRERQEAAQEKAEAQREAATTGQTEESAQKALQQATQEKRQADDNLKQAYEYHQWRPVETEKARAKFWVKNAQEAQSEAEEEKAKAAAAANAEMLQVYEICGLFFLICVCAAVVVLGLCYGRVTVKDPLPDDDLLKDAHEVTPSKTADPTAQYDSFKERMTMKKQREAADYVDQFLKNVNKVESRMPILYEPGFEAKNIPLHEPNRNAPTYEPIRTAYGSGQSILIPEPCSEPKVLASESSIGSKPSIVNPLYEPLVSRPQRVVVSMSPPRHRVV